MELIILFVLGIFVLGVIGFFISLSNSAQLSKQQKRISQMEDEISRLSMVVREALDRPRRVAGEKNAADTKPEPAPVSAATSPVEEKAPASDVETNAFSPVLTVPEPPAPMAWKASPAESPETAEEKQPATAETVQEPAMPVADGGTVQDEAPAETPWTGVVPDRETQEAAPAKPDEAAVETPASGIAEESGKNIAAAVAASTEQVPAAKPVMTEAEKADWEARIGKRWLTWGGVLLLVAATGFLIKYAYDQGWIGPWTQIAIGIAVGCGLCILGDWQVRVRNMRPLGQGVMALGLTLVYLTCFGAYAFFKLEEVSQVTALVLMALTSGAGILLSNRHRSMPICILAAIGGYLAPPLVSTGHPPPVNGLFTYTVLVNLGVIVVAMIRTWPAMPLLAFAGTVVHFWGWYAKFYTPEDAALVGMWAAIFHFLFLVLPSLPLLRGRRQTPWQWLLPVANAALGVYVTWTHLRADYPLALMLILLGMAAIHIAIGLKARTLDDSRIVRELYSILGLAILTLVPLAWFGMQANLVCWLLLGVMLVELGCRLGFVPYRAFGYINLAVGVVWCVVRLWTNIDFVNHVDAVEQFAMAGLGEVNPAYIVDGLGGPKNFLASLFDLRFFWTRLLVPVAWGLCALILHRWRARDGRGFLVQKTIAGVGAVLLALIFISNDVNPWTWLTTSFEDKRFALGYILAPAWCLGMLAVALAGWRWRVEAVSWLSLLFLPPVLALVAKLFFHQIPLGGGWFLNAAWFAMVFFSLCCMAVAWTLGGGRRALCAGLAGYVLILTVNSELYCWRGGGEYWLWSLLWNAGALIYAAVGWKWKHRDLAECFWPPYVIAALFAQLAMLDSMEADAPLAWFANVNYLSAMMVSVSLFLKSLAAPKGRLWMAIIAGWLLLAGNHMELYSSFRLVPNAGGWANQYEYYWTTALLYNVGALLYAALHWRFGKRDLRTGAALPALAAAFHLVYAFYCRPMQEALPGPFANMFYANEILLALTVFIASLRSEGLRVWLGMLGGYLLLVATHLEIGYWQGPWMEFAGRLTRTAWYTALWSVGAVAYLAAAVRWRRKRIYFAAIRVLSVAVFCAGWQYYQDQTEAYSLFLNARFLTSFLVLAILFVMCRVSKHYEREVREGGFINVSGMYRRYMYVFTAAAGFLLLSFECYDWCILKWGADQAGRRVANMSLSIAWGFYSIFLLITGFATRIRGWRLSGLLLFGVTCLKLVIIDLARLEQLHRILSFMAVGLLLMAASYLYHKLEKRLKEKGS